MGLSADLHHLSRLKLEQEEKMEEKEEKEEGEETEEKEEKEGKEGKEEKEEKEEKEKPVPIVSASLSWLNLASEQIPSAPSALAMLFKFACRYSLK